MYPRWHGQASTSTLLAGTGHARRLNPALSRCFRIPALTNGPLLAGAVAGASPLADRLLVLLNRAGIQEIPETS